MLPMNGVCNQPTINLAISRQKGYTTSMKLLTESQRKKLIENHRNSGGDFKPVVKMFNPTGAATWLFTELDEEENLLFGLCDLGMGFPELGYASLDELESFSGMFGLGIERDIHFKADKPLSEYAREARENGGITV